MPFFSIALHYRLKLTGTNSGGDIFTSATAFTAGTYWLSFDYFGHTTVYTDPNSDTGGYVGISEAFAGGHTWLYATGTASGASDVLIDDDNGTLIFLPFHLATIFTSCWEILVEVVEVCR